MFRKRSIIIKKMFIHLIFLLFAINQLTASATDSLFASDEMLVMTLRTDFSAIQQDRLSDPQYHEGELIYSDPGGKPVKLYVRVMVRGNFRRDPENCKFPPLLLNFRKKETENTLFENQDKLKLVTPCLTEEDVIDEYTVYRMYNRVTDLSFRVRLVKIIYYDTAEQKELFGRFSFFIEDEEHVAERNNATIRDKVLTPFDLDSDNYIKLSVFQYLIGNSDWWVSSRKNIVIMQSRDTVPQLYAVPYDFDITGFVNPRFIKHSGITDFRKSDIRIYKGICFTETEFDEVFNFYRQIKPSFESIINDQSLISKTARRQNISYIDYFYKVIDNKNLIKKNILNYCETRQDYNLQILN